MNNTHSKPNPPTFDASVSDSGGSDGVFALPTPLPFVAVAGGLLLLEFLVVLIKPALAGASLAAARNRGK
jgi:hypothetical protein